MLLELANIIDSTFYPLITATCAIWVVRRSCTAGAGFVAVVALTLVLKHTVGRVRPDGTTADSFPSAHAATALYAAFAGPLFPVPLMVAWATLVAWSRVRLCRHHPSDVVAGLAIGAVAALTVKRYSKSVLGDDL